MKICFVMCHTGEEFGILSDLQYSRHYGYEQWYCRAIMDQGCDATLIVLSYRPGTTQFQHVFGHKIVRVPVPLSLGVSRQLSIDLFKFIRTDLKDIDIFHIHSYHALLYEPLAFFLRHLKKKFVTHCHSAHYSLWNPVHLVRLGSLFFSLRLAERVLTVDPLEYLKLRRIYRLKKRAVLFPSGINTDIFKPLNSHRMRNSVLFVGRLWPEKGISILFKAFELARKEIPDISLTIVGRGPLEKLVLEKQEEYEHQVEYFSYVDTEKLIRLYNTHELFVLPSLNEPFGNVVLESLACKTPVVTADNCGAAILLRGHHCVETVPPHSHIDFSRKIVQLLKKADELRRMGEIGRKVVVENFDWKIIGKNLEKIYEEILTK